MDIILSTRNPSKALQARDFFRGSGITIKTLGDMDISGKATENGATLEENAYTKAYFARKAVEGRFWTMADDTGIFINALNGEPGVLSARWAGAHATTEEITKYTLARMAGIADRSAIFRTVVVAISPEGEKHTFMGEVRGTILEAPRCAPHPKMPYSAIFVPDRQTLTWAEMTTKEENAISHRGKAFRQLRSFLQNIR